MKFRTLIFAALAAGAVWAAWPAQRSAPVPAPVASHATFAPAAALVVSKIAFDVKFETDRNAAGARQPFRSFVIAPINAQVILDLAAQPLFATRDGNRLALVSPPPQVDLEQLAIAADAVRAFAIDKSFWDAIFVSERRVLAEATQTVREPARAQAQAHFDANRARFDDAARAALVALVGGLARDAGAPIDAIDVTFRALTETETRAAATAGGLDGLLRPGF